MKKAIITLAVFATWWGAGVNFASAQFGVLGQPPPRTRPTVSPFINLRGGAMSYYGIIRPQTDASRSIQQLQNAVGSIGADGMPLTADQQGPTNVLGGLQTGHTTTYFNYGHYYPTTPTQTVTGVMINSAFAPGIGGFNSFGSGYGLGGGLAGPRMFFAPVMNATVTPR